MGFSLRMGVRKTNFFRPPYSPGEMPAEEAKFIACCFAGNIYATDISCMCCFVTVKLT